MIYKTDKHLRDFDAWSGGYDVWIRLTWQELEELDDFLDEVSRCAGDIEHMMTETEINDFLWFDLLDTYWNLSEAEQVEFWKRRPRWEQPF